MDWEKLWADVQTWLTNTGIKIVVALLVILITFPIINGVKKKICKGSAKNKKIDKTISHAFGRIFSVIAKLLVLLCLVAYLGIDTSGVTALIASLGVGVGLAINGTLSNFAGGVLLLITRPFKDDDYITACGYDGIVEDIHVTYTKIRTYDNKTVFLPNGTLSTSTIVNHFDRKDRRVDLNFSIAYSANFDLAKETILRIFKEDARVLQDPAPVVVMAEHGASSINITARAWTAVENYWDVLYDSIEKVKKAFDKNGIEIPFSQLDVHVKKD